MWKYQCKKHLLFVLAGMLIGVFLFQDIGKQAISEAMEYMKDYPEAVTILQADYMPYLISLLYGGGVVNTFLLIFYLIQRYNAMWLLLALLLLNPLMNIALYLGLVGLIPCMIACIYGILTIPNRGKHKNFEKNKQTSVSEIERVYRLHHKYHKEFEGMAKKIWITNLAILAIYGLGVMGLMLIVLEIDDLTIMIIAVVLFSIILFGMMRKRNEALQPVIALLFEKCDPEACASVIFALAKKSHSKKAFPLGQYLAQCMIYLNDPHLAIDVLVLTRHNALNTRLPYHSVMAYAYYQLGDASEVKRHYELCEQLSVKGVNSPLSAMKKQYLDSIKNKLDLMDERFDQAKVFYRQGLEASAFEVQKVDFRYYLGLIAFAQKDYDEAKRHFEYVIAHGNKMYFVEKAKGFIQVLDEIDSNDIN